MSDWETPWISSTELDWQVTSTDGYQSKIVQLNFADGSTPVKIQMVQNDSGYWKPIGMVDSVTAKSGDQELGIGADARWHAEKCRIWLSVTKLPLRLRPSRSAVCRSPIGW